jgi:type IV secretion system protein VirB4
MQFFAGGTITTTTIVVFACVAAMAILLFAMSGTLSKLLFPKFGFVRYSEYLPFSALVGASDIRLKGGELVRVYKFAGLQTSLQDTDAANKFLDLRAQLFDRVRNPNVMLRFFTIRDHVSDKTDYEFDQPVLQKIYDKWNNQGLKIFQNTDYLVVSASGADAADALMKAGLFVESVLSAYGPELCTHNSPNNAARFFGRILSPVTKPQILNADASMSDQMTVDSVEFLSGGNIRYAGGPLSAIVSFKIAPDFMDEEFFTQMATIQTEMIIMNSFNMLSGAQVENTIKQKISTTDANTESEEIAAAQIEETRFSMDENISGAQSMAAYYPSFEIFGRDKSDLEKHLADARKICAEFGVSMVVENFAARVSWFARLPGFDTMPRVFKMLSRTAATATNMSRVPTGVANSDWGPGPIVVFPTAEGSPYQFQFHVSSAPAAVAHTLTIGPTGGGKTTLFSFLIAQSMRHQKLRAFFFDRNRGAEIFTLATGGKYLTFDSKSKNSDKISAGFETALNPLKMEDTDTNRAFLRRWLAMISGINDPRSMDEIARAVAINFDYLNDNERELKNIVDACFSADGPMRPALKKWVDPLQYGSVFNESRDTLDLHSRLTTFDFTDVLADPILAAPVVSYILHRINNMTVSAGAPALIMIDETAPMLENAMFRENFVTGLQEGRKNRQAYMAAFQRANVLDKLGIGDVVRGQAQTVMFFRNPGADSDDYAHWKLNPLEMAFIAGKAYPNLKRAVLLSRPITGESVILNTELGGLGNLLRLFESGRSNVLLAEELYKTMNSDWVEEYLKKQNV